MTRPGRRHLLGTAALMAAGLLVGAALAEAVLRALRPPRLHAYVADDTLLYRLRPGLDETMTHARLDPGRAVRFRVDERGFRGDGVGDGATAARRVAVYGDSFVEARYTPPEATFAGRLRSALAGPGTATEVLNAGVTGYGPDQVALRLERELPELRPQVAVVVLYAGNDWGDLVRNKLFRLDEQGAPVRNHPRLDRTTRLALGAAAGADNLALVRGLRRLGRSFRAAPAAPGEARTLAWALRACQREHEEALAEPSLVTNLFLDHYDADLALTPAAPSAQHKRRLMQAVLARMKAAAVASSVPLLLVVVPDWRDVCAACPHREETRAHPEYRPSALTDAAADLARGQGIPFLDLFPAFSQRADALYYPRDGHWNDAGQALAAELVAARLIQSGLLR